MGLKLKFIHFKSFHALAEIEIAPITLIYGENSSGKSTIIEFLRMIRQSGSSKINTKPRTNSVDDLDLGEQKEILSKIKNKEFSNDKEAVYPKMLNYNFIFSNDETADHINDTQNITKPKRSDEALENLLPKFQKMTNKQIFRSDNPDLRDFLTEGKLNSLKVVKGFTLDDETKSFFNYDYGSIELNNSSGFVFKMDQEVEREKVELEYEEFGDTSIEENQIIKGCITDTWACWHGVDLPPLEEMKENDYMDSIMDPRGTYHSLWYPIVQSVISNADTLKNSINTAMNMQGYKIPEKTFGIENRPLIPFQTLPSDKLELLLEKINDLLVSYDEELGTYDIFSKDVPYSYEFDRTCGEFCYFLSSDLITNESVTKNYRDTEYKFKHMLKGGWYGKYLSLETSLIEHIGRQLKIPVFDPVIYFFLSDRLTLEIFKKFKFIPSLKNPPSRTYQSLNSQKNQLNSNASNLAEILFHNPEVVKKINNWLMKSHFKSKIEITEIRTLIYEIKVFSVLEKKPVNYQLGINLKDSGSGLYNILPIITQSLLSKDPSLIALEEPEVTLHPKLQIALADLIAKMTKEKENSYLIETHSEHLILNMQKLIKEGKLPSSWLKVYVTTKDEQGSHLHKIEINEEGDFTTPWPGGFFEERSNILFGDFSNDKK